MTIAASALKDQTSGKKEEENKIGRIAQIDVKGKLSEPINWYKSQQPRNGTSRNSNISNTEGGTNHRKDLSPVKQWYDKLSVDQKCQVDGRYGY